MAAYTSAVVTGNWSAGATWVGGVAPPSGAGHTVTIVNGAVVTVDVNWDIGLTSPSPPGAGGGTAAITVTGPTGKLIIGAVTLTCRGDLSCNTSGGDATLNAGAILEFDASGATTPLSQVYRWNLGNGSVVQINGTAGARCQVRSNASGGNAYIRNVSSASFDITATYCDFTRLGSAAPLASIEAGYLTLDLQHCVFDTCGRIEIRQESATNTYRLLGVTMKNTLTTACIAPNGSPVALTAGTRVITDCVFDKVVSFAWRDYTITNTIFQGFPTGTTAPIGATGVSTGWAAFTNNLLTWTAGGSDANFSGSVSNCYCFNSYAVSNPHYLQLSTSLTIPTVSVTGCVFEDGNSRTDGDCIMAGNPPVAQVLTVAHNLGLPNASRTGPPGTLVTAHGNANSTILITHNTWFLGTACTVIGESYAGHAGQLQEFRDNLCWDDAVHATGYKLHDSISTMVDHATVAGIHHNAGFNHAAGSNGGGYNALDFTSSVGLGANDVNGTDPDFVDDTRNLKTWDASLAGGAGSAAHALAELIKINEAGYNPAYTIAALLTWVKAGFVPQASAMHAASDSVSPSTGWIGALQGTTAAPPVVAADLSLLGVG